MPLTLVIEEPSGKRWTRQVSNTLVIGRDPKVAQLVLQDDYVSRNHATITRRSNGQWLYIHHGRNASRLDDAVITGLREQALIRDQSRLRLGAYRVTFISDEEPATEILASRHLALDQLEDVLEPEQRVDSGLSPGDVDENPLEATLLDIQIPFSPDEGASNAGTLPLRSTRVELVQLHGLVSSPAGTQAERGPAPAAEDPQAEAVISKSTVRLEPPPDPALERSSLAPNVSGPFETMDFSEQAVRLREQEWERTTPRGFARVTHFLRALWQRFRTLS